MSQPMANKISNSPSNRFSRASPFNQSHHRLNTAASSKQSTTPNELPELALGNSAFAINTDDFKIGDRVWVGGVKPGIIAFIGEVQFAQGEWAGVVLDSPVGKNDGSVNGLRYFMCEPKRGIFSTLTKLTKTYTKNLSSTSEAKNLSEVKVVDSLENNMPDKSQKFADQKYPWPQKDHADSNISSDLDSNTSTKQIPDTAARDKMSYIQSEASATKVNQLELTSSLTNDKRKISISSSSSQSSGRVDGLLSKINVPFKTGDRVLVSGSKEGIVRFIGEADFAKGVWVGVELKEALGKNDGSVAGKRYFHCAAMHGLFAPVHKVEVCRTPVRATPQRQQRSHSSLAGNAVSKSSSHNSNLTNNRGSQESISSIGSAASSASRRMKLGVTSLSGHRTKGSLYNTPTLSALQKTLKEKEEHIEQLIKERDLDRSEFIRTAAQIDEVEGKLMMMQSDKRRFLEEMDSRLRQAEELIITLEGEKNDLRIQLMEEKRKYEDLQFSLEEANIEKSDIQSQIEKDSKRLKELDEKLKNEMQLNDKLTNEVKSLKMLGLSKDDPIDEYLDQIEELTHKLCVAENRIKAFEKEGLQGSSVHLCRKCSQNMSADAAENSCDVTSNDHLPMPETRTLKNQVRTLTQEKLFAEAQRGELEEDLKKVSAEKDLIELELTNLVEDHKKLLEEKEKLLKDRLTNQRLVQEAGIQIKNFEQKVEKLTCDFATRMDVLKKRAETAEKEAHCQKMSSQQLSMLKKQVEQLNKQVETLTKERDSLTAEVQKLKTPKAERNQTGKSKESNEPSFDKSSQNGGGDVVINSIGIGASLVEKLKSEKDFAESQIDFLNAVIIDLQKKNSDLESQLKAAESSRSMTDSLMGSFINSDRPVTLRMFCDICDVFDQHETEDCPMQNMTSSPLNASQHHGSRDEERPYCTSCEVFGHTTDECKDEQTY